MNDRSRDPAHLPAKLKVIAQWIDAVSVADQDDRKSQDESHCDNKQNRLPTRTLARGPKAILRSISCVRNC
jgi:hypothetical protein